MSMFNDISWGSKDNEQECELSAKLVSIYARRFSRGRWSFLGPGSEKKWYSAHESKLQGQWDRVAELMMIKFAESGHPVFSAASPLSRGTLKSKGGGKLSIHFCADEGTIETVFRTIISVNQLSIYGAVSELCEEYKAVPVSVERSDQDKDADENVDADQVRTERPVESEQSIGLFTQREEIDIDFRVSGLSHAVVKQSENVSVRELVKKIESHPHRQALQADLQQNNAFNPFSNESKAMIREMGNVELSEFMRNNSKSAMLRMPSLESRNSLLHLWTSLERKQIQNFHQWRLDAFSSPPYVIKKRGNLVVLGTAKLRHRKSISWPTMRGGDVSTYF